MKAAGQTLEIEDGVPCQTVTTSVKLNLAAGHICKRTDTVLSAKLMLDTDVVE